MRPIRRATKAIIIAEGKLLVLRIHDEEDTWFILPGTGLRFGETLHDGLRRECREELGMEVEIGDQCFVRDYIAANHEFADADGDAHQTEYMFECRIPYDAGLGSGVETDKEQVGLEWLPVESLEERPLFPKVPAPLILELDAAAAAAYLGDVN